MANNNDDATTTNNVEDHPNYWRYHIPQSRFGWLYSHMSALGWKSRVSNGSYQAPPRPDGKPGRIFENSDAVFDYLNSFALPEVYTNLQWATTTTNDNDDNSVEARHERDIGLALRKAIFTRSQQKQENVLDYDDDSDVSMDEESSSSADKKKDTQNSTQRRLCSLAESTTVTAMEKGADLYLRRKAKTRSKSTASPKTHQQRRLSLEECRAFGQNVTLEDVEKREASYQAQFAKWRFLLSTNHSLLFYGAGSKRELLNSFAVKELYKEGETLVIDGTDENVTMEGLLDALVHAFLDGHEPIELTAVLRQPNHVPVIGKSCPWKVEPTVERAIMVGRGLAHQVQEAKDPVPPTFLMIHSLDACLATPVAQEALAALVTNSTVANGVAALRLVASVDHVDAPTFLWDSATESNFSWFPCCVHTYRPFVQELSLIQEDSAHRKRTERASRTHTQAQRILDVLQGLAPRHTEVVQLLAQLHLSNRNEWVDYLQYRDRCKSACPLTKTRNCVSY